MNIGSRTAGIRPGGRGLVTGGAGFIGSHLVDALLARGHRVRVLDDLSGGLSENLPIGHERLELLQGSVTDRGVVLDACREVDAVFHLAALGSVPRSFERPDEVLAVNAGGTAAVCDAAVQAGARRMVLASSSSVYGDTADALRREGHEGFPCSPYAASKRAAEDLVRVYAGRGGTGFVALRFFNVYGPRQRADVPHPAVIPRFLAAAQRGAAATVYGDGEQRRDFTYVSDVVTGLLAAAGGPVTDGGAVNLGTGAATTVNMLLHQLGDALGHPIPAQHRPPRAGDVRDSLADLSRARTLLTYEPAVSLAEGLRRTVEAWRPALDRAEGGQE